MNEIVKLLSNSSSEPFEASVDNQYQSNDEFNPYSRARKHLDELLAWDLSGDFEKLPPEWMQAYSHALLNTSKALSDNGDKANFYYRDVEQAYSIYKLATNPEAREFGYDKLSYKMPYTVFEIGKDNGENKEYLNIKNFRENMPKKEFWDSLNVFVPLYTDRGDGSFYSTRFGYVSIPLKEKGAPKDSNNPRPNNINRQRLQDSEWYQSALFYHEFGHAYDDNQQIPLRDQDEFKDLFNRFIKKVNNTSGTGTLRGEAISYYTSNAVLGDDKEQIGALNDCIQAADYSHRPLKYGSHPQSYYQKQDGTQNYRNQRAEFIAHLSEIYWSDDHNNMFQKILDDGDYIDDVFTQMERAWPREDLDIELYDQ